MESISRVDAAAKAIHDEFCREDGHAGQEIGQACYDMKREAIRFLEAVDAATFSDEAVERAAEEVAVTVRLVRAVIAAVKGAGMNEPQGFATGGYTGDEKDQPAGVIHPEWREDTHEGGPGMNERVRVYMWRGDNPRGFPSSRPWSVGPTPEDARETCWPTWDEAMRWATMPASRRRQQLDLDAKFEMGQ